MKSDAFSAARRPYRLGLGLLLLSLGLVALNAGRAAAVELNAMVGFGKSPDNGSRYRMDSWTPVTVYLSGQGASGVGQLQVTVQQGQRTTTYTRRVPLHSGNLDEVERFSVYIRNTEPWQSNYGLIADIDAQLLQDGRKLAEKHLSVMTGTGPETYNILALTPERTDFSFLSRKKLGLVHRHLNPSVLAQRYQSQMGADTQRQAPDGINPYANLQVLNSNSRALPTMAQGYDMIDAIVLGDYPLESLEPDQVEAIKQYVRDGGLLIVTGGGEVANLQNKFCKEMLPVTVTGGKGTGGFLSTRLLAEHYRAPFSGSDEISFTGVQVKPDAHPLLGTSEMWFPKPTPPMIFARPYGSGTVVFTAFDPFGPQFWAWEGSPALWRDLLRCGNEAISPRDLLANNSRYSYNPSLQLADALAGKQATNTPDWWTVAFFLGAYIFLLVPVMYLVLKRLDKREYAWLVAPVLIFGFTASSYMMASSIKGGVLTVNRIAVFESQANSEVTAGYAQMTLYSPRRAAYDISFGAPSDSNPYRTAVPSEIFQQGYPIAPGEMTVEQDKTATIRGARVRLWDKRSFDVPVTMSLGGGIEAKVQMLDEINAKVTVTNRTRYTLRYAALVNGAGQTVSLGDLAPGATHTEKMPWIRGTSASHLNVGVTWGNFLLDTNMTLRNAVVSALNQDSVNYNYWGAGMTGYGKASNALVGWFSDPVLDVRVDGKQPAGEQANLLFVHLPTPENASHRLRMETNPFEEKPIFNLPSEGQLGRGGDR